jgi:hypothetical protein
LVRPVREQLEHDRVIRLLQVKLKKRPAGNEVIANIGEDQTTSVKIGQLQIFPDIVLTTTDRGRKLMGTVEVETSESVNHLEARSQWAHLGRARAPFHLYVPLGSVDIARRLAAENQVHVSELWSFHTIGDQTHFRLVHRTPDDTRRSSEPRGIVTTARPEPPKPVAPPPPPPPPKPIRAVAPVKPTVPMKGPAPVKAATPVRATKAPVAAPKVAAPKKVVAARPAVKKRPAPPPRKAKPVARKPAAARAQKRK